MEHNYSSIALHAAKAAGGAIEGTQFAYHPEIAAGIIDQTLQIPLLINIVAELLEEAKRDLAESPNWAGPTVRISKNKLRELANIISTYNQ